MKKFNNFLIIVISVIVVLIVLITNDNLREPYSFYSLDQTLINLDDYKTKYTIVSFTFTSCPVLCPATNLSLSKLEYRYGDSINILTINVDPENDTPERIKTYMDSQSYGWDVLVASYQDIEAFSKLKLYSNRKLTSPADHLASLYLMDKEFDYIDKFSPFPPEKSETGRLIAKLDSLLSI